MKSFVFLWMGLLLFNFSKAQDSAYGREIIKNLTSENYWGRGYTKDGMEKAAEFIADEFKKLGVQPLDGSSYFQNFEFPANSFPGKMELNINGKKLIPGVDFIVGPESASNFGKGNLQKSDSITYLNQSQKFAVEMVDKLTWSASAELAPFTLVQIKKSALSGEPKKFEAAIENEFITNFQAANVCSIVKGTTQPDSFIFITAHYDHLGGMGANVFFPGANDNASGVAMMLNMAKYYSANPSKYSVVFIAFAAEEIGLKGSKYFVEHPLVPLQKIRMLLNMDLEGNGVDGITVVNATEFPKDFSVLKKLNEEKKLLKAINERGKAANSDHYFFSEQGVPAFFFYTLGGSSAYHDVTDVESKLKLEEFIDVQKLMIQFIDHLDN